MRRSRSTLRLVRRRARGPFPAVEPRDRAGVRRRITAARPRAAKAVYVSACSSTKPGEWRMVAIVNREGELRAMRMPSIEVTDDDPVPAPGEPSPVIHTPTADDVSRSRRSTPGSRRARCTRTISPTCSARSRSCCSSPPPRSARAASAGRRRHRRAGPPRQRRGRCVHPHGDLQGQCRQERPSPAGQDVRPADRAVAVRGRLRREDRQRSRARSASPSSRPRSIASATAAERPGHRRCDQIRLFSLPIRARSFAGPRNVSPPANTCPG